LDTRNTFCSSKIKRKRW